MVIVSGIDLSVGSIVALSTVVTALFRGDGSASGALIAALGAVTAGALCGALNGVLITQLRVVPFIVTLGTMLLVRGAAKGLSGERRLEAPATWLNDLLRTAQGGHGVLLPSGIWLTAALAVAVAFTLQYTRFGRHLFAVGSSERTARLCGVRITRTKIAVYTAAGALAALAGVLMFSKLSVGDPTVANGLELDVIAAVIIGGGSLRRPRQYRRHDAGAAILAIIQIGCSQQGLPNWARRSHRRDHRLAVALDRGAARHRAGRRHRVSQPQRHRDTELTRLHVGRRSGGPSGTRRNTNVPIYLCLRFCAFAGPGRRDAAACDARSCFSIRVIRVICGCLPLCLRVSVA